MEILLTTVMPFRLQARAWMDPGFADILSSDIRSFLIGHSSKFPRSVQYVLLRDTASVKHYIVPHFEDASKYSEDELSGLIEEERKDDVDFGEWLPSKIIARAIKDDEFLSKLIRKPSIVLFEEGYKMSNDVLIFKNSSAVRFLALRHLKSRPETFETAYEILAKTAMLFATGQCCGTGTCLTPK